MPIRPYQGQLPRLGLRVYVDPGAHLMGDVELGDDVSLWPGVVAWDVEVKNQHGELVASYDILTLVAKKG